MTAWRIDFYRDKGRDRRYRWKMRAPNGAVVAHSAVGYVRRSGVIRALSPLATALNATVWESFTDGRRARQLNGNVVPITSALPRGRAGGAINLSVGDEDDCAPD